MTKAFVMKGLMVFSPVNDISYIDSDKEFTEHVNKLAVKQGLLEVRREAMGDNVRPHCTVLREPREKSYCRRATAKTLTPAMPK